MALSFLHKPIGSTIGSGTYKFRHYGDEVSEQLDTPEVAYTSKRQLVITPVENADYYKIYNGNTYIGSISYDGTWTPA